MKTLIIVAGLAAVVGLAAFSTIFIEDEIVVTNERKVATTTVEVQVVDKLEERIKEAQEAAHTEIEAEVETYRQQLLKEIADEVKMEYIKELESTITSPEY